MLEANAQRVRQRASRMGRGGGWLVIGLGVVVMLGWVLGVRELQSVSPGWQTTKPWTAVALLLGGLAVVTMTTARRLSSAAAALVVAIAAGELLEYAARIRPGYDTWLFGSAVEAEGARYPGRMAVMTAIAFALLGVGFLLHAARRMRTAQSLWFGVLAIGSVACLGYLYDATELYAVSAYSTVALPTALGLVVLSASALARTSGDGLLSIVTAPGSAGVLVRRLLPISVAAILAFAGIGHLGRAHDLYGEAIGSALVGLASLTLLASVIVIIARPLARAEQERQAAEDDLRELNATLEQRVDVTTRELRDSEAHFRALSRMLDVLNAAGPDPGAVMDTAVRRLADEVGDACAIGLFESDDRSVRIAASYHRDAGRPVLLAEVLTGARTGSGGGPAGEEAGFADLLVAPLEVADRPIGVLAVARDRGGSPLTPLDRRLVTALAGRIAAAIDRARLHDELESSEERLRTTFERSAIGIAIADRDGLLTQVNPAFCTIVARPAGELLGQPFTALTHPVDRWIDRESLLTLRRGDSRTTEKRMVRPDGSEVWARVHASARSDPDGNLAGFSAQVEDVTARKEAEEALRTSEERFRTTFEDAPLGMAVLEVEPGPVRRWLNVNDSLVRMLGHPRRELLAEPLEGLVHPDDAGDLDLDPLADGTARTSETEVRLRHADGHFVWVHMTASSIGAPTTEGAARVIVHFEDVTERRDVAGRLARAALHDPLTGLPNRMLFMDRLGQQLSELRRTSRLVALFYLDLDRFKSVNDTYGHEAGDALLVEVADRLRALARPLDTAARLSGDEFVLVCGDLVDEQDVLSLSERLQEGINRAVRIGDRSVDVSASIGVALTRNPTHDPGDLLRAADTAMYQAKGKGRKRFEIYDEALARLATQRLDVELVLHDAIEHGLFRLEYQPIVDIDSGDVVALEALLRLEHPTRGLLGPDEFLGIAEDSGLIIPIGDWVIQEACRQLAKWEHDLDTPPSISVNVSGRQIAHRSLRDVVLAAVDDSGADPSHLYLEMTETVFMEATRSVVDVLHAFKARGIRLAIDDFGTGYSSLAYLKHFPIDLIKIDRSFTAGLARSDDDTAIVHAITNLGRSLDLTVIAEGVETRDQLDALRHAGCHLAQGFLFAPAMPPEKVAEFMTS